MKFLILSFFLALNFPVILQAKNPPCQSVRAAFDIGSGSIKIKVAKVDTCKRKILKILLTDSLPVGHKADIMANGMKFSEKIQKTGIAAIEKLMAMARAFRPQNTLAVATSAFRQAKNAKSYLQSIAQRTGIVPQIISQRTEALLGYQAVGTNFSELNGRYVVWDIGGGSMQMTFVDNDKKFHIYQGQLASVTFKDQVLAKLQRPSDGPSNPLTARGSQLAQEIAKNEARVNIPDIFKKSFKQNFEVIGIGGVHYHSVSKQIGNQSPFYTLAEVNQTLKKKINLTAQEIDGPYSETEVTNLALVSGLMAELAIEKVRIADINMADALLVGDLPPSSESF